MLKRKVKVGWLLMVLAVTSFFTAAGFMYYNSTLQQKFDNVTLPIRGLIQEPPEFFYNIEGEKVGEFFSGPLSVAVGKNKVYVTDSKNHRVNVYGKKGKFLYSFGQFGVKQGEFNYPNTIAVDKNENIFVGEFQNRRIQVFNEKGKPFRTISGSDKYALEPLSISIYKDRLYVANKSGEILILDIEGKLIKKFGYLGTAEGSLNFPNGIAIAKDGRIFVSDSGNGRIQVFSSKGKFQQVIDEIQYNLVLPRGIAFDGFGFLYVVDTFNHNVIVYDEELNYMFTFGNRGIGVDQFNFPNDIAVDAEFRIYVADRENNRISVFNYR